MKEYDPKGLFDEDCVMRYSTSQWKVNDVVFPSLVVVSALIESLLLDPSLESQGKEEAICLMPLTAP